MSQLAEPLAPGSVLDGRYEIERLVGSGGMGLVYAARRLALGDSVAIKVLPPGAAADPTKRRRFLVEARAAAHVRHPNVIQIFDSGDPEHGSPWFAMELLEGTDLEKLLTDHGALDPARAVWIFARVCSAVEAGHRRGIVHRDLKPANVLLAHGDDGREIVKVVDFGLARLVDGGEQATGELEALAGTPAYMAPEQIAGEPVAPPADIWTLAVLLYRLVTGELPFEGDSVLSTMRAVSAGSYRDPTQWRPDLPPGIREAIRAGLRVDPDRRPRSAERLARLAEGAVRVVPSESPPEPRPELAPTDTATQLSRPVLPSFVGRDPELRELLEQLDAASRGDARIVLVSGEDGIGKSRLVEEVSARARASGALVLRGRFHEIADGPSGPFEAFRRLVAAGPEATTGAALEEPGLPTVAEGDGRWRLFTALTEALAARAGSRVLVVVLEDVQWATRAEVDLIHHLHRDLGPRGTLLLSTYRRDPGGRAADSDEAAGTDALPPGFSAAATRSIELRPFDEATIRRWLEEAYPDLQLHPRDLRILHRATDGNPGGVVEVVRRLLADGLLHRGESGWVCDRLPELELPRGLASHLALRIERQEPELREVLDAAAIVGFEQRFVELAAATGLAEDELEKRLGKLLSRGILRQESVSRGFDSRFASPLLHRLCSEAVRPRRRRELHRRLIAHLEADPFDGGRRAARLAEHHHAVDARAATVRWGLAAVSWALARYDDEAAEKALARVSEAFRRAREAGEPIDPVHRLDLDRFAGVLARRHGELEPAVRRLERALAAAESLADPERTGEVALELSQALLAQGRLAPAREMAARAERAAGTHELAVRARLAGASALSRLGRTADAAGLLRELLDGLEPTISEPLRSLVHRELSWALLKAGRFREAEVHAREALDLARGAGDLLAEHHALAALASVYGEGGDERRALPLHRHALELSRRLSLRRREGIDLANLGESYWELGDVSRALDLFRQALGVFLEIGDRACQGDCRVNVGRALLAAGRPEEARATLEQARELCEETGRREYAAIARLHLGEALQATGDLEAAAGAFAEAAADMESQGFHLQWRALLGRARVAALQGDPATAQTWAARAREAVERQRAALAPGMDSAVLDAASRALDDLGC